MSKLFRNVFSFVRTLLVPAAFMASCALCAMSEGLPKSMDDIRRIKAESWSVAGRNIHLKGNVHIPAKNLEIYADEAIVNINSHDVEAFGNIRVLHWQPVSGTVDAGRLASLENRPDTFLSVEEITGDIWGERTVKIKGYNLTDTIDCDRLAGNIKTGYFKFDNLRIRFKTVGCVAESGERLSDGTIKVKGAEISGCSYLEQHNSHYSIGANEMIIKPYNTGFYNLDNVSTSTGDHSVLLTNGLVRLYGVPVLWLPAFYKPKDESPGLFSFIWGKKSGWEYFVSIDRRFNIFDDPYTSVRARVDYYNLRGFGYGLDGQIAHTEETKTNFMAYSIYDMRPDESEDYDDYRLRVPHDRYVFRLSHLSHITPRLDFRAQFHWTSDYYFTKDFFPTIYGADPQPSTFVSLEHQFDNFSAAMLFRPRVNRFYTTVEKLPEIRVDVPRQQLFGTPVYYQGDAVAAYMRNKWIDFNEPFDKKFLPSKPKPGYNNKLHDYEALRFDTTHFLYLPINLDWINFVPRAGVKFTAYSSTSKDKVTTNELLEMFSAADPQNRVPYELARYDKKGGAKTRLASELGFELSTKIHNSWNDVRNSVLGIDGLRHIIRPYINYTFINVAGVKKDHIYYFDDIDRIDNQNFFRFGVENRLQTRSGSGIRDIFSMENFLDIHLKTAKGFGYVDEFSQVGDFGTIISMSPLKNLTISTSFLIALDNDNGDIPDTYRNGRNVGKKGLQAEWLNRWNVSITYKPIEDVSMSLSYNYNRPYSSRSAYSMGSTLTQIQSGGYFDRYYDDRDETFSFSISAPLTPDRRTFAAAQVSYDVQEGGISDMTFILTRRFHCVELIATLAFEEADKRDHKSGWETEFSMQARLLALEAPLATNANEILKVNTAGEGKSAFSAGL